ncbi:MAG: efflux RND transporter periplasmic adaptor subunit, partial [Woeseiaceae bacterium]|nr:efflux RND transporter periplasmic adaptor subunit [Woeseiaceae bacterium]
EQPQEPRRWPWILAGVVVAAAVVGFMLRVILNGPIDVTAETVRLTQTGSGASSVLDASGYVVARRQATVSSKIAGKILDVLIEEGMRVEKDQVVARLDASSQNALLALAQAQAGSARAVLVEIQAQLTQAELDLARSEELHRRQLTSNAELDAARANAETLLARLASGRENVVVAQRNIDVSQDQLNNTVIRAPFAGVVVTKNAQPGEMISPISAGGGFTRTGICTIVDMTSLEIEVDVNEAYIQRVQSGQPVDAVLDAYPDWNIPAEVIAIVPTADRQKATVRVRIGFRERDERVLRDMGVKVAFLGGNGDSAETTQANIYINRDALRSDNEGSFVWIVRNDTVQRRAVSSRPSSSRGQQVTSGLSPGDRIIVAEEEPLTNGQAVRVTP